MKHLNMFLFAMTVSACIFFAGRLVIGSGSSEGRPLAKSLGAAAINECNLTGRIEGRANGVYAIFDIDNPSKDDRPVNFHYAVTRMPAMSMLSRMMPRPEIVKKGVISCQAKTGHATEEVLLKEAAPSAPGSAMVAGNPAASTNVIAAMDKFMTPESWSLVVSRGEIREIRGWGAVAPAVSDSVISLDKGEAVIASTIKEKQAE